MLQYAAHDQTELPYQMFSDVSNFFSMLDPYGRTYE